MDIEEIKRILRAEMAMEKERVRAANLMKKVEVIKEPSDEPKFVDDKLEMNDEPLEKEEDDFEPEDDDFEPIDGDELADMCFKLDEIKMLTEIGLPPPSQISESEKNTQYDKAEKLLVKIGGKKGHHVKKGNVNNIVILDNLMNLIRVYMGILKPKKDQTGGRYKQNRRNAYKIGSGGEYGNLVIHLPSLFNLVLEAYKDGKKVFEKEIDQDTIDLLTKRFNGSKNYSELSKNVFSKLNRKSEIPAHRSSMKYSIAPKNEDNKLEQEDKLLNRLGTLCGYLHDGYNSKEIENEFIEIIDQLYDKGVVDNIQRYELMKKYL